MAAAAWFTTCGCYVCGCIWPLLTMALLLIWLLEAAPPTEWLRMGAAAKLALFRMWLCYSVLEFCCLNKPRASLPGSSGLLG